MGEYKISVIILNYKQKELTRKAVYNLLNQKTPISIVVVDNDSRDGSFEYLFSLFNRYDNIEIIKSQANLGYAQGNNFGVRHAIIVFNPEYVGIMNPDVILPKDNIIEELIGFLDKNVSLCTGLMFEMGKFFSLTNFAWKIPDLFDDIIMNIPILNRLFSPVKYRKVKVGPNGEFFVDVVSGSFFIIRTQDFLKVGMFDEETFLYGEERILGRKLKQIGKKVCVLPKVYFYHNHHYKCESLRRKIKNYIFLYKSRYYYNKKYNTLPKFVILPLLHISFIMGFLNFILEQSLLTLIRKIKELKS